jgi:transposase
LWVRISSQALGLNFFSSQYFPFCCKIYIFNLLIIRQMHFDCSDLQQLTPEYVASLSLERRATLVEWLRKDLMEAHDRLNQNPSNSSRPPSSRPPWDRSVDNEAENSADESCESTDEKSKGKKSGESNQNHSKTANSQDRKKRKPGKQPGAKGFGRTQKLTITQTIIHRPTCCKGCERTLNENLPFHANGGYYTIDLVLPKAGCIGLQGEYIKHIYGSVRCTCGFETMIKPERVSDESGWVVEMGEWKLIGPLLLAFLVFLKLRMHMTLKKTRELLSVWLGISLSDGCINTALREAGRAASSLEPELIEALKASGLLHVDETGWKEHKITRWFWVAIGDNVAYYIIGPRSSETAEKILAGFKGWIMTDGYHAYRQFENRLRCWSHLERKAKSLEESWDKSAANFGAYAVKTFELLRNSVYRMREIASEEREEIQANCDLERLHFLLKCLQKNDVEHEATRAFAVEILNDHQAIFRVLKHPELPLTNNRAELFLRNWVILRNMCHGSKTEEGSRTISILASIVDTLSMRKAEIWQYLADVIKFRRSGHSPPPLPVPA